MVGTNPTLLAASRWRRDHSFISALDARVSTSFFQQKKPSGWKAYERLDTLSFRPGLWDPGGLT